MQSKPFYELKDQYATNYVDGIEMTNNGGYIIRGRNCLVQ